MAEPRRDEFPNNFMGNLVWTERGWTVVPPTCRPAGHDYARPGLLGLVQLQRPTHGVALLVRRSALRPAARAPIAESVTKARYRCGKTSNAAHQTKASEVPIRGIRT
jgi:hypothetical protein